MQIDEISSSVNDSGALFLIVLSYETWLRLS